MNVIPAKLKKIFQGGEFRSVIYMGSQCVVLVLAFLINVVLTNYCTDSVVYGQYKYATNFILTVPAICSMGITWSCASIIAKNETQNKNAVVTASLFWMTVISVLVTAVLYLASFILPAFGVRALTDVRITFPFVVIFMLQTLINQVYSGLGESYQLSLFSLIPNSVIMLGMCVMIWSTGTLNYMACILLYLCAYLAACLPKLLRIKYDFSGLKDASKTLFQDVKNSGFKVHLSSMFTSSATQIIALCCGSVFGYTEYGYYSLAASLATIFQIIGSTVAVVNFKKYSNIDKIPKKDFLFMLVIGGVAYLAMSLLIDKIFYWFYPMEYAPTIYYLKLLGISYMFYGFAIIFNRFFISKGQGKKVMKNSMIVAITNVVVSIPMIWLFKIQGLVIAALACSVVCLVAYCIDYGKWIKGMQRSKAE